MTRSLHDAAFAAHQSGDSQRLRELVSAMGVAALDDALMLQLLALTTTAPADGRALLQQAALEAASADAGAWFNLGVVEQDLGLDDRALLRYEQALRLDPAHPGALTNLCHLLYGQLRFAEAWQRVTTFLAHGGDPAGNELRFAKIADDAGEAAAAVHWFARAAERFGAVPALVWERAMQQLRDRDYREGWRGYEARRALYDHAVLGQVSYAMPQWDGAALGGRSLLLHKEQGLGDMIMFASCLPDLPRGTGAVHIAVQPPLVRLFEANFPWAQVWASTSRPGAETGADQPWLALAGPIDLQLPLASLGLHLRSSAFPPPRPYLAANPADRAVWADRLARLAPTAAGRLRAGLVIAARRDGVAASGVADGAAKSMSPQAAGRLAVPGVQWVSLHDRATAASLAAIPGLDIVDTSDWLFDLADTAALIAELDCVVAVDTAVAHLAGAMGKKVLLMLRAHSDWRWGRSGSACDWYGDVEIFRQPSEGDWWTLADTVRARLGALAATHPSEEQRQ